jgi:hypothetical protein
MAAIYRHTSTAQHDTRTETLVTCRGSNASAALLLFENVPGFLATSHPHLPTQHFDVLPSYII